MKNGKIVLLGLFSMMSSGVFAMQGVNPQDIDTWMQVVKDEFVDPVRVAAEETERALVLANDPSKSAELAECLDRIKVMVYKHQNEKTSLRDRLARARGSQAPRQ